MSQDVMVELAQAVSRDFRLQRKIEAKSDAELVELGLDADDIASIRGGFFTRVLQLGLALDDRPASEWTCCV